MSSYATKADLKNATGVDTSKLADKSDLASLKAEVDKIDVDKLKTVPVDLSKLRNLVKNEVFKKTVYDKLVTKVNNIDNSKFVLKTKCETDKPNMPSISGLATTSALTAVQNKIPDLSSLVKKKQIIMQKLVKLKRKSLIIIMINTLLLQNLISLQQIFLLQD